MPAVAGGNQDRVDLLAGEQLAEVRKGQARLRAVVGVDQLFGGSQPVGAGVGDRRPLNRGLPQKVRQNVARAVSDADAAKHDPVARRDGAVPAQHAARHNQRRGGRGEAAAKKAAAAVVA